MTTWQLWRSKRGQNTMEYALLIAGIVVTALVVQYFVRSAFTGRARTSMESMSQTWHDPTQNYTLTSSTTVPDTTDSTNTKGEAHSSTATGGTSSQTATVGQ